MQPLGTATDRPARGIRPSPRYGRFRALERAAACGARALAALAAPLALALAVSAPRAETATAAPRPVLVLEVKGAIGVATAEAVARGLARAREAKAGLVVLRLDTPGGLVSSTREIIRAMLASPVPVAVFVAPAGARAASAGTYMIYAAHVAAMADGTHLGAATPIALGAPAMPAAPRESEKDKEKKDEKDGLSAAERKSVNDAAAYLRALAQLRGRNAEWAERAVRSAATLTNTEAHREKVIDVVAADVPELLAKIDGRTVTAAGAQVRLATKGAAIVEIAPDWRIKIMAVIGDPTVAYLLLLLGVYGILFEFWSPGAVAPGVIGGIALLLGLGALTILPVDFAGLGLVALGIGLMAAEAFTPGIGALGIGGLAAFVAGSILLFDPDAARGVDFGVAWPVVAGAALVSGLFLMLGLGLAIRARRRPVVSGRERMIGSAGKVIAWEGGTGTVRVAGEEWAARSSRALFAGDPVVVVGLEGLTVVVEPGPGARR
jgi:membrane-bound serine protease (ClpP class)